MRTLKCIPSNQPLLKIAMWNIQGLTSEKLSDSDFRDKISNLHIIGFVETWADDPNLGYNLPQYDLISLSSRKKNTRELEEVLVGFVYLPNLMSQKE
jgi:hypothetical protein